MSLFIFHHPSFCRASKKGVRSHCSLFDAIVGVHVVVALIQGLADVPLTQPKFHYRTDFHA